MVPKHGQLPRDLTAAADQVQDKHRFAAWPEVDWVVLEKTVRRSLELSAKPCRLPFLFSEFESIEPMDLPGAFSSGPPLLPE